MKLSDYNGKNTSKIKKHKKIQNNRLKTVAMWHKT